VSLYCRELDRDDVSCGRHGLQGRWSVAAGATQAVTEKPCGEVLAGSSAEVEAAGVAGLEADTGGATVGLSSHAGTFTAATVKVPSATCGHTTTTSRDLSTPMSTTYGAKNDGAKNRAQAVL